MAPLTVWVLAGCLLGVTSAQSTEDNVFWYREAEGELEEALNNEPNRNQAKNIIVFIGDGMGIPTITAARIYKGQQQGKNGEEGHLYFEKFPHVALSKTYNPDRQVPDSAGTATAYWCGYKGNYETLGVDARVSAGQCTASRVKRNSRPCLMEWAQEAGKDTGIVTTTRITHATPAALYAKSAHRNWECDEKLGERGRDCVDIARQLVENAPGKLAKVIFGGGRQNMIANLNNTRFAPENPSACKRQDGRDLTQDWLSEKRSAGLSAKFVATTEELRSVNLSQTDHIMGLFGNSHTPYEDLRDKTLGGTPSLVEMTETAIKLLSKNEKGFFLAVEGGRIDHAHHDTKARRSLSETLQFEEAVKRAHQLTSDQDTLIVVTADHSHVMTIQGYPVRGKDILGASEKSRDDGMPYTTLFYSNGPNWNVSWNGSHVVRGDLNGVDTTAWEYTQPSGLKFKEETHGGEDVAIYATGPWSHLFHGVHEQSYIPHVISHAARIGPRADCKALKSDQACAFSSAGLSTRLQAAPLALLLLLVSWLVRPH
ncbi:alkaline phosphatase-like [Amphibalanus amphitrite]|uniref:alkaline phosphatase-like n=1 Tax=Amphibalanus amphitrite TaxID=1232801 RepID=UPI001C9076AB|nr:alkaline phosphatase-like [Amphibalanus amphitrite]